MCHYPIYGDRLLIGRSNLLYACAKHPFALFSASRWHRRAGGLQPTRTRTWLTINKMWSSQVMCFSKTTRSTQTPLVIYVAVTTPGKASMKRGKWNLRRERRGEVFSFCVRKHTIHFFLNSSNKNLAFHHSELI